MLKFNTTFNSRLKFWIIKHDTLHTIWIDLGDFKVGEQIIRTVRYADDLVLLAKEETILQSMINNLIEAGRRYGTEINVENLRQ
jgi:hypothetical protein